MIFVWVVTKPIPVVIMSSNEDLFLSVPRQCISSSARWATLDWKERERRRDVSLGRRLYGARLMCGQDLSGPHTTLVSRMMWTSHPRTGGLETLCSSCQSDIANMNQRPAYQKVISLLWSIFSKSQVFHCEIQSEIVTRIIIDIVIVYLRNKAEPWYLCYCLTQK